jgi:hypothetical protein
MKEGLYLMTSNASISQRRDILEVRCMVVLPEDRILIVEADSFAIYGIPPLQPMVPTDCAGADGVKTMRNRGRSAMDLHSSRVA